MSRWVFVFVMTFAALARSSAEPPVESLKEFVIKNKTRHAVGLYLQNKKVGYMIVDLSLGKHDDKEVAVEVSEMLLSLSVDGEKTTSQQKEKVIYSLDGDGPIVFAEHRSIQDKKETINTATRSDKGMTIVTTEGADNSKRGRPKPKTPAEAIKRDVPLPKANLAQSRQMMQWLENNPKAGATMDHWTVTWDEDEVDTKEVFHYKEKKKINWGGVQTDVHSVTINMKGAIFNAEVLTNGNPVRGTIGGLLELRAESEEVAKKLSDGEVDMIAASSIKVDKNLGDSKEVVALTLEVIGLSDFTLPENHRQKLRRENGKIFIDLQADYKLEKGTTLSDAERKKYTSPTPTIQCGLARVNDLAKDIVGKETDTLKKADKIKAWVYRKVRKTMASNASTTTGVLDSMAGDCTEHTLLFVSLARAAGIPARELTGVAHIDKIFGWHAWAEFHDGHQWVSVDPTWNELYVDATHIVFAADTQDHSWLNVLGRVSFKAVKVEKK